MPIISSTYRLDSHKQTDGSRYCRETHTSSDGRKLDRLYKLPDGQGDVEAAANLAAEAANLSETLAEQEVQRLIDGA